MLRTFITLLEIVIGLGGLLCVNYVRRRFGDTAAGATAATSVLLLIHSIARRIGDSRLAQAWSMLVAAAMVILIYSMFFPVASDLFASYPVLQWGTPILFALGFTDRTQYRVFGWMIWAAIPLLWGQELMTRGQSSNLVREVASLIPSFDGTEPASPTRHTGLCPPGEVRRTVGAPCVPKGSAAPAQAVPAAPAPTPAVASVPGTAAGAITVCDKNRKEVLTDYQLIGGGVTINVFNPLKCNFSLNVKPGGTIRVTFYDNSQMDMNHQTCAIPTNPGCMNRFIKSISSVTPSSIIMLEVTPVR